MPRKRERGFTIVSRTVDGREQRKRRGKTLEAHVAFDVEHASPHWTDEYKAWLIRHALPAPAEAASGRVENGQRAGTLDNDNDDQRGR